MKYSPNAGRDTTTAQMKQSLERDAHWEAKAAAAAAKNN